MKALILRQHGIKAIETGTSILAVEQDGTITNVSKFSISKLYKWLGY